jgi:hypothetical protein
VLPGLGSLAAAPKCELAQCAQVALLIPKDGIATGRSADLARGDADTQPVERDIGYVNEILRSAQHDKRKRIAPEHDRGHVTPDYHSSFELEDFAKQVAPSGAQFALLGGRKPYLLEALLIVRPTTSKVALLAPPGLPFRSYRSGKCR